MKKRPINFTIINATIFKYYIRKKKAKPEVTNLYKIDWIIEILKSRSPPKDIVEDIAKVLARVPTDYYSSEELEVFSKADSNTLPEYKVNINYKIKFEDSYRPKELGINPLYRITLRELEEYRKYITENL